MTEKIHGETNPQIGILVNEAINLLNQGEFEKSLSQFSNLLNKYPSVPEIWYGCALAAARLNRPAEAKSALRQLLEKIPSHPKGLALQLELEGGEKPQIKKTSPTVLGSDSSITTLISAGQLLLSQGDFTKALEAAIEAKKLRIPTRGLDLFRSECFVRLQRFEEAAEALKEELRFFPDHKAAEERLAEVLKFTNKAKVVDSSDPDFNQILERIRPYTMLSNERLWTLYSLAKEICQKNIAGNFIECGVAAGGSSAMLAYVIKKFSKMPRWLYSFDSFEGMPEATEHDLHKGTGADASGWGTGTCAAPEDSVRNLCKSIGVDDVLKTVKGYFEETLPKWRDHTGMISLLHLDGDWYESTKAILDNLYDHVVDDGAFQVDDYGYWEGCKKAIHEFADKRKLTFDITQIDGTGVWFRKPDRFPVNSSIHPTLVSDFKKEEPAQFGIESQMSENERFQIYYAIRAVLQPQSPSVRFVEVGCYSGASYLLSYIALRRVFAEVKGWAVEPSGQRQFFDVLKLLAQDTTHIPKFSHEAAALLKSEFEGPGKAPAFMLIDGDHSYEGVKQDMLDYYPMLAPGGLIVFHDYLPAVDDKNRDAIYFHHANSEPGIRRACHEIMEDHFKAELIELPILYPTNPEQTQAHLPIIPEVYSTIRVYRKPK